MPAAGSHPSPATGGTSFVSDKLRATFKCPKFLGEVRYWKTWNQGFVRFLSINELDYVIDEGFLALALTPRVNLRFALMAAVVCCALLHDPALQFARCPFRCVDEINQVR